MWSYSQSTGEMTDPAGDLLATGYSGNGDALCNPAMQNVIGHGPIPQGDYEIGPAFADPHKGPDVMRLIPNPANEMFGRDAFLIHGDNAAMDHSASDGCIILDHPFRVTIAASEDRDLTVTE